MAQANQVGFVAHVWLQESLLGWMPKETLVLTCQQCNCASIVANDVF